jgi:ribonuclease HI
MVKRQRAWSDGSVYPNKDILFAVVVDDGSSLGHLLAHVDCGKGTVNDAEYQGVIFALKWARDNNIRIDLTTDSQLVDRQVRGVYACTLPRLRVYRDQVRRLLEETGSRLIWRSREANRAGWFFDQVLKDRKKKKAADAKAARQMVVA